MRFSTILEKVALGYENTLTKVLSLSLDETDLDAEPILDSLSLEEEGRTLNCVLSELVNYADSCENNVLPIKVDFILMVSVFS